MDLLNLTDIPSVMESLRRLSLEYNLINEESFHQIMDALVEHCMLDLDVRFDGNPIDGGKSAFALALDRRRMLEKMDELRRDRDRLQADFSKSQQHIRQMTAGQTTILAELLMLRQENQRLEEEKEVLVSALAVTGTPSLAEEQLRMPERLAKLEAHVFGHDSQISFGGNLTPTSNLTPMSIPRHRLRRALSLDGHDNADDSIIDLSLLERMRSPGRSITSSCCDGSIASTTALSDTTPSPSHTPVHIRRGARRVKSSSSHPLNMASTSLPMAPITPTKSKSFHFPSSSPRHNSTIISPRSLDTIEDVVEADME